MKTLLNYLSYKKKQAKITVARAVNTMQYEINTLTLKNNTLRDQMLIAYYSTQYEANNLSLNVEETLNTVNYKLNKI